MQLRSFHLIINKAGSCRPAVRVFGLFLAGFVAIGASYFLMIAPEVGEFISEKHALLAAEKQSLEMSVQARALPLQKSNYREKSDRLLAQSPQFSSDKLLHEITQLAAFMKLKIVGLEPLNTTTNAFFQQQSVHLILEGDFRRIHAFLERFLQMNALSGVDTFSLRAINPVNLPPKILHFDATIMVFYAKKS